MCVRICARKGRWLINPQAKQNKRLYVKFEQNKYFKEKMKWKKEQL